MDLFEDLPDPNQSKNEALSKSLSLPNENDTTKGEKRKLVEDHTLISAGEKKIKGDHEDQTKHSFDFHLKGFVADRQGEREDMQDAHVIMDDLSSQIPDLHPSIHRLSLYCVFDGHGGSRASRFASQHLHNNLLSKFPKGNVSQVEKEIKKVIIETFKKTDEEFLKEARSKKPTWKDGSTAVMVLAINNTLYIANLGDSKAILCRYKQSEEKCIGVPLTVDQTPSVYEERIRIQKSGGWVKEGRVMGQLEVSRSIGDGPYKNHGVISVPDVKRCQLADSDQFIMIACDGLWKSYTIDESIEFVNTILKDDSVDVEGRRRSEDAKYNIACGKLASSAVLKLSGDNVTVVVVAISKKESKKT